MRRTLAAAVGVISLSFLAASGCKPVDVRGKVNELRGEGFDDETGRMLGKMRKADPDNKSKWGWTSKAQEIEDNLGVR